MDARLLQCVVERLVFILEKKFSLPGVLPLLPLIPPPTQPPPLPGTGALLVNSEIPCNLVIIAAISGILLVISEMSISWSPSDETAADGAGVDTMRRRTFDADFFELYAVLPLL